MLQILKKERASNLSYMPPATKVYPHEVDSCDESVWL